MDPFSQPIAYATIPSLSARDEYPMYHVTSEDVQMQAIKAWSEMKEQEIESKERTISLKYKLCFVGGIMLLLLLFYAIDNGNSFIKLETDR